MAKERAGKSVMNEMQAVKFAAKKISSIFWRQFVNYGENYGSL